MAKSLKLIAGQCHLEMGIREVLCRALIRKDVSLEVSSLSFNNGPVMSCVYLRAWMSFQIRSYQSYATESGTKQKTFLK